MPSIAKRFRPELEAMNAVDPQDPQRDFFGQERLLAVARDHRMGSAQEIQAAVMEEIYAFMGDQPQFDDIALLVLVREA